MIQQVSVVMGSGFVLSFQESPQPLFEPVKKRLREKTAARQHLCQADFLVYSLLDNIVDGYFPVLEFFNDQLDLCEEQILQEPDRQLIHKIHEIKRNLLALRRAFWPQREAVHTLSRDSEKVGPETGVFLRDCYDHLIQVMDILESHRERASDLTDIYLSSISNKMNEIMKVLTIIATIFIPLGFIAGVYGMNFDRNVSRFNMPELGWSLGYPFALALMLGVGISFLIYFKRKGWLD